jgi:tagatose-6-phosphate ketose/aldose isomerase
MLYAGLLLLAPDALPVAAAEAVSAAGERLLDECEAPLRALVQRGFGRTVYLGSGALAGIAHEAALKLLELTDGAVAALSNTPLGFRHGPKTFLTPDTLVVVFVSGDRLARRYDLDLLRELKSDGIAGRVLALSTAPDGLDGLDALVVPGLAAASDLQRGFLYLLWAQLYAFHRSLSLGRSPDTPSVTGAVHRVVQGVTIHPLES